MYKQLWFINILQTGFLTINSFKFFKLFKTGLKKGIFTVNSFEFLGAYSLKTGFFAMNSLWDILCLHCRDIKKASLLKNPVWQLSWKNYYCTKVDIFQCNYKVEIHFLAARPIGILKSYTNAMHFDIFIWSNVFLGESEFRRKHQ